MTNVDSVRIAMIGGGFMGKAHAVAYATMPMFFWPVAQPVRQLLVEVDAATAAEQAARLGFAASATDWRTAIEDPTIDAIDIATPNDLHAEIAVAAARAGKHILCEKPLARTGDEAATMLRAVRDGGVVNMAAFNFRRTPAVVLAKQLIDAGRIGTIRNFRSTYLQDWPASPDHPMAWRFRREQAGSGAVGDIGSHALDLARYLVGDIAEVSALTRTYIDTRPVPGGEPGERAEVDVDDEVVAMLRFEQGAVGSLEASRVAHGRHNYLTFEAHGTDGSILFDYEHRDQLRVADADAAPDQRGFTTIFTGPDHPYGEALWPGPALGIGYGETKIIECYEFIRAVTEQRPAVPDFEDAYRVARVVDALVESAASDSWVAVQP